jgi:NADPH-dependent ferric siderophore reductase
MNLLAEEQDIMGDKTFRLSGTALPKDAGWMLDEICEHFVEHATVERDGNAALLKSALGAATLLRAENKLLIDLACPTAEALQLTQNSLAEHMFYFAGDEPLELTWSTVAEPKALSNFRTATVVGAEDVTPHMRRVKLHCTDVSPFLGAGMHVRLLLPPRGRAPVWPTMGADGRLVWPVGEDEIAVRVYTIRAVDPARSELWLDFLQHPKAGIATPGADFARDAEPGQVIGMLGPGGGDMPVADTMLLAGDESALPAIARIAAEAPAGAKLQAIIEVANAAEEQPLPSRASLSVQWLHREAYAPGKGDMLRQTAIAALEGASSDTFIWVACEKDDLRAIRAALKARKHDRKRTYAAWYWERS